MRQNYLWSFTKTKPWLPYIIPVQTHKTRPKIWQLFCRKGYFHTKEVWVYVCVQYACILGEFHCWPQWTMMMYQNNYPGKEQLLQGQANIWLDHTWPASVKVLTMLSISKAQETRSLYLLLFPILLPFLLLFLYFSYSSLFCSYSSFSNSSSSSSYSSSSSSYSTSCTFSFSTSTVRVWYLSLLLLPGRVQETLPLPLLLLLHVLVLVKRGPEVVRVGVLRHLNTICW